MGKGVCETMWRLAPLLETFILDKPATGEGEKGGEGGQAYFSPAGGQGPGGMGPPSGPGAMAREHVIPQPPRLPAAWLRHGETGTNRQEQ
jgi:hypothetical protein